MAVGVRSSVLIGFLVVLVPALVAGAELLRGQRHSTIKFSDGENTPTQVHIAYGEDGPSTSMWVSWMTAVPCSTTVHFGLAKDSLTYRVDGNLSQFTEGNAKGKQFVHRTHLSDLSPNTRYYYVCESDGQLSNVYTFITAHSEVETPTKFLVFGDMGRFKGAQSLPSLIKEINAGDTDVTAVIHTGDFAYDMFTDDGMNGDLFMEQIEPIAAYVPYMTCVGNHEIGFNFSHYLNRFSMPLYSESQNMWYSWNIGRVHFIAFSTEVLFSSHPKYTAEEQMKWLINDLQVANEPQNRADHPWIIAYGHRPMYCSNSDHDDCTTPKSTVRAVFEELFFEYGVDIVITAHEHSYERLWPVFNETVTQHDYNQPKAPVNLISGAAGCNEDLGFCINPIFESHGPWSAFHSWLFSYGYGHLTVHNSTHVHWDQYRVTFDDILDDIWIVKDDHGPFTPL